MWGAIIGDIVGSIYEFKNHRSTEFELFPRNCFFTDDSILTVATAATLLESREDFPGTHEFAANYRKFGRLYPGGGYGGRFKQWLLDDSLGAYGSMGNGSAMRVSPVAWFARELSIIRELARDSARPTHDHLRGLQAAEFTAVAIAYGRRGVRGHELKHLMTASFPGAYDLERSVGWLRENYEYSELAHETVPEAFICVLEADSFEQAIRNAVSIGGDTDTVACIAGSIAEALFPIPPEMLSEARRRLPPHLLEVVDAFDRRIGRIPEQGPV